MRSLDIALFATVIGKSRAVVRRTLALHIAVIAMLACDPGPRISRNGPPPVVGHIIDAATGAPMPHVFIDVRGGLPAMADTAGWYELDSGGDGPRVISIVERGYLRHRSRQVFRSGRTDTVNIVLSRAAPPCCRLDGTWFIDLRMKSPGYIRPVPETRRISGRVLFSDTVSDPLGMRRSYRDVENVMLGYFDIPFARFFGSQVAKDISTTVFGGSPETFEREVYGSVFAGDSIDIAFIPRISHGGVSLLGRIDGDSITGHWTLRAFGNGSRGDFMMVRIRP